jgi:hypothetical protein
LRRYTKVLDGISRTFAKDDANFAKRLVMIERLPPRALGIHPSHLKVGFCRISLATSYDAI